MLDSHEVVGLEKRWQEYKHKRNRRVFFIGGGILGIVVVILVGFYLINLYGKYQDKILEQNLAELKLQKEVENLKQSIKKSEAQSKDTISQNNANSQVNSEINLAMNSQDLQIESINENELQPREFIAQKQKSRKRIDQEVELPEEELFSVNSKNSKNNIMELFNSGDNAEKYKQNLEKVAAQKPSGKISIQSKEIGSSIPNLTNRFNSTGNVKYAILLAQEYYAKKDYRNAEKWSYTVNNLDKNSEEGWIIFAKARYKLGKKDDAIIVLDTYRQKNPSKQIDSLITQMQTGTL